MRSSVDLDLSSGPATRRFGWDPALDLLEQISEQQADWSVSEKNSLEEDIPKYIPRIWASCHLRDSSSVEKSYSVVSLSPRTMLSASSTLMSRLSWGSTVWLVIVTNIMSWCQR